MASIWFDGIDDLNKLSADLTAAGGNIGAAAQVVVRKTAMDITADAKAFCPVDTGNLRNSISHTDLRTVGQSGVLEVEIGPTAAYGAWVEWGNSRTGPQAFMGPALDRRSGAFMDALAQLADGVL